jgi:hypothetical protein
LARAIFLSLGLLLKEKKALLVKKKRRDEPLISDCNRRYPQVSK